MDYVDVSAFAKDLEFGKFGCPVRIDLRVWNECVQWTENDNQTQIYQEQDNRLLDILYVAGATLHLNPNEIREKGWVSFQIHCIPRDGKSIEARHMGFRIEQEIIDGTPGLIVRYNNFATSIEKPGCGDLGLVG
jgi:hypothetical protein